MAEKEAEMDRSDWLLTLLRADNAVLPRSRDFAGEYQQAFKAELEASGFHVLREVQIQYEDGGKRLRGRIDLVAVRGDDRAAIELDFRRPRKKSMRKVAEWAAQHGGYGWVVLRDPAELEVCYRLVSAPL